MSTEDDLATIERVTAALAGPLKVWVLCISDDSPQVWLTQEALLVSARSYMQHLHLQLSPQQLDRHVEVLQRDGWAEVNGTQYYVAYTEVQG